MLLWADRQPLQRRVLTVAVVGTKVYVLCGLDSKDDAHNHVDVFDAAIEQWAAGPEVSGGRIGFSPAAKLVCVSAKDTL